MPAYAVRPLVLAVDATHEFGSLALAEGERILEEVPIHSPSGFGHVLFERIGRLLSGHGVKREDLDLFAAASGPGSFTGVRVGLACVKGLAEALGKPAAAVSNLQAMASFGTAALRAPILDARRGEIYGAVYNAAGKPVSPEVVARFPAWLAELPGEAQFVAMDFTPFAGALAGTRFEHADVVMAPRALAGAVARIAAAAWLGGERADPAAVDANYVRRSDAELFWKE